MTYKIEKMDLMKVDSKYVICHCISADCGMGAGVVVPIKKKYIGVKPACEEFSIIQNRNVVGKAFRYACSSGIVYNLFTKHTIYQHAGVGMSEEDYYTNLEKCLYDMKAQMIEKGEHFLAMPKIACGIDVCKWNIVEDVIKDVFESTDIKILVCVL